MLSIIWTFQAMSEWTERKHLTGNYKFLLSFLYESRALLHNDSLEQLFKDRANESSPTEPLRQCTECVLCIEKHDEAQLPSCPRCCAFVKIQSSKSFRMALDVASFRKGFASEVVLCWWIPEGTFWVRSKPYFININGRCRMVLPTMPRGFVAWVYGLHYWRY